MPRRNPKNKIIRKVYAKPSTKKTRYNTKQAAEKAADELMLLNTSLTLETYQDIDLGWYLTNKKYNKLKLTFVV